MGAAASAPEVTLTLPSAKGAGVDVTHSIKAIRARGANVESRRTTLQSYSPDGPESEHSAENCPEDVARAPGNDSAGHDSQC